MKHSRMRIVCLAKSRKNGGLCLAGKSLSKNNVVGNWIRPVSPRLSEEISPKECKYDDGCIPELLDIIQIPVLTPKPAFHQCENYLIADDYYWCKKGVCEKQYLAQLCDHPKSLWPPHDSSYYGLNDRVHESFIDLLKDSLYLISPSNLAIVVQTEGAEFGNPRRKVRAQFEYHNETYIFPITDTNIERMYYLKENGRYTISSPYGTIFMCVSIGLPYAGYCYKFIASIISKVSE